METIPDIRKLDFPTEVAPYVWRENGQTMIKVAAVEKWRTACVDLEAIAETLARHVNDRNLLDTRMWEQAQRYYERLLKGERFLMDRGLDAVVHSYDKKAR